MERKFFGKGDHVVYFPRDAETNPTSGVIKEILQEGSLDIPRYVIVNDRTHKETTYKLENIIEKVREGGYGEEIEEFREFKENIYEEEEFEEEKINL